MHNVPKSKLIEAISRPVNNVPQISPPPLQTAALECLVDADGLGGGLVVAAADGVDKDELGRDVMEYESEVL